MIRGWVFILPGWCWLYEPQPICTQPVGLGLPNRAGRCRLRRPSFSSPVCRSCRCMEGFLIRDETLSSPIGAGSTNPSQSTISQWGWVSTPCRAVSTRGIAVFVHILHRAARFRPGEPPFSSPVRRRCRCIDGFLVQGWGLNLPGCGGTTTFPRRGTCAARPAPPHWPRAGVVGSRPMDLGLKKRWIERKSLLCKRKNRHASRALLMLGGSRQVIL